MLTLRAPKAISGGWGNVDAKTSMQTFFCNVSHANVVNGTVINQNSLGNLNNQRLYTSLRSSAWYGRAKTNSQHLSNISSPVTLKQWLRPFHICASSDDEYRSSRNIAISLFRRYRNAVDRGGGDNLKEFISAAVNAYAVGCTDEGLRKELMDLKDSGFEIQAMEKYGGSTSLKSKILSEEVFSPLLNLARVVK